MLGVEVLGFRGSYGLHTLQGKPSRLPILTNTLEEQIGRKYQYYPNVSCMQATIDLEMEAKLMEHKKERELLGRRHMDRDNALRKVRKATQYLDSAQNQLPPLKASLHASKVDVAALKKVQSKTALSVVELKKDTDILINSFLKEEKKVRQ